MAAKLNFVFRGADICGRWSAGIPLVSSLYLTSTLASSAPIKRCISGRAAATATAQIASYTMRGTKVMSAATTSRTKSVVRPKQESRTLVETVSFDDHPFKKELTQLGYAVNEADIVAQVDSLLARDPQDTLTYEMIFRALARADLWEKAVFIFETIGNPNLDCYRAIFRTLAGDPLEIEITPKSERGTEALKLFRRMLYVGLEPDAECAAFVMTTQRKSGNIDEVERIFHLLQEKRKPISQGCFNALMLSCGSRLSRAQKVFAMCETAGKMNAVPFYGLILSSVSDWRTAVATLKRFMQAPFFLTPILSRCYDAALKACERAREVEATEVAFGLISLWSNRPKPAVPEPDPLSSIGLGYLLGMCGEGPHFVLDGLSNPYKARFWLEEAKKRKLQPAVSWYLSAIKACTKGLDGEPVEQMALEFFQEAREQGFRPTLLVYEALICLLHDWTTIGELLKEVVENAHELQPNTQFVP